MSDQLSPNTYSFPSQHTLLVIGLQELQESKQLTDVTLVVEDKKFPCHRSVLAASSQYFRAMFTGETVEKTQSSVSIHGVTAEAMGNIINFIYTANIELCPENIQDLFATANMLAMTHLCEVCIRYMHNHIGHSNCIELYLLGHLHDSLLLKDASRAYILDNFSELELSKNEAFAQLPVDFMEDLLSSDELNIEKEELAFNALLQWVSWDVVNRGQHLLHLLKCLRFPFMSGEVIQQTVLPSVKAVTSDPDVLCYLAVVTNTGERDQTAGDHIEECTMVPRVGMYNAELIVFVAGSQKEETRSVCCFDPVTKENYCAIPPNVSFDFRYRLDYHEAVVTSQNQIFCLGGIFFPDHKYTGPALNSVKLYNARKMQWIDKQSMREPRCAFAAVVHQGKIYAIGGKPAYLDADPLSSVESYEIEADHWTMVSPMPFALYHHAAVVCQEVIYVIGGLDASSRVTNVFLSYDPVMDSWTTVVPQPKVPRAEFAAAVYERRIYIAGGRAQERDSTLSSVEVYDPVENRWRFGPELPDDRRSPLLVVFDGKLYMLGGLQTLWNRHSRARQEVDRKDMHVLHASTNQCSSRQWTRFAKFVRYANSNACVLAKLNTKRMGRSEYIWSERPKDSLLDFK
ncbi:kelch-like protein 41 [Lingula anatina]|uniref:Kelch-like protein 41 n=1 Tax=Lingula anatina TaxID=7574 RepID=A0A1S3GY56_LINAN|nr:kelch-like protein 41 [Lingula anatina]XP_013378805.1 kelch-like protein 41 [Lingula anatina]XP_023933487.1 kelch-like protein 41 [Lingula anatina]|eukprot:XP_013378804.1 kelch-like protein 41 [Lingula anatina]